MTAINIVVEDELSELVCRKLIEISDGDFHIGYPYGLKGKDYIRKNIKGFNNASKYTPYLVLVDLDNDRCAPDLIQKWLKGNKNSKLLLRIAIREVESWLLGHRLGIAKLLGINVNMVPSYPETLADPKRALINLAKRSPKREVKTAIVPAGTARIGPGYNSIMGNFVNKDWDAVEAANNAPSLKKTIEALNGFNRSIATNSRG